MAAIAKCPQCGGPLSTAADDPDRRRCAKCGARFRVRGKPAASPTSISTAPAPKWGRSVPGTLVPAPTKALGPSIVKPRPAAGLASRLRRALAVGGALAVLLLSLAGVVVITVVLWPRVGDRPALAAAPPGDTPPTLPPPPAPPDGAHGADSPPDPQTPTPPPPPAPPDRKPAPDTNPTPAPRPAEIPPEVNRAIDRGIAFLKTEVKNIPGHDHGRFALVALTLLECGVSPDDPILAGMIRHVRDGVPNFNTTYTMSATILLLDRLGREEDEPVIRRLALQLAAAQTAAGGWNYVAPQLAPKQLDELQDLLVSESDPVGRDPALAKLPAVRYRSGQKPDLTLSAHADDNSNTQFAALALWVARKHGVPVDRPLAFVEARFRATQDKSGGWGYGPPDGAGHPILRDSMTCAGLLGLAVGRAVGAADERKPGQATDEQAEKALRFLSETIRRSAAAPVPGPPEQPQKDYRPIQSHSDGDLYYLWSLERVGVLYDLKTIGGVDWHVWETKLLLGVQNPDGSWSDRWGQLVGTCFALLFLKRVNVAEDLTARLQLLSRVKDPLAETMTHVTTPPAPGQTRP